MAEPENGALRQAQLAGIGRLMAGVSHEFKNHLAIIRELNGLAGDLLAGAASRPFDPERHRRLVGEIDARIEIAAEMCRHLSRFAHRMDEPCSTFDPNEALEEVIYLLQRFARQKQVELLFEPGGTLPAIHNDPALLQFAVFELLQPTIEGLSPDGRITIATRDGGQGSAVIAITVVGPRPEAAICLPALLPDILNLLALPNNALLRPGPARAELILQNRPTST